MKYRVDGCSISSKKTGTKTFDELASLVQDHHTPKPSKIVQRFKFYVPFPKKERNIAILMVRDRLVCRIMDNKIQKRLLAEKVFIKPKYQW